MEREHGDLAVRASLADCGNELIKASQELRAASRELRELSRQARQASVSLRERYRVLKRGRARRLSEACAA